MTATERPRPLSLGAASARIFDLSLGEMLWSRRSLFLALIVGGPVVLAAAIRTIVTIEPSSFPRVNGLTIGGPTIFGMMIWLLYARFVVPVLGVFYGTSLIADEVEDRTITYLFTRPIPRGAVVIGKYLAYLACTVLLVLPSVVLVYFLVAPLGGASIGESVPMLLSDLGLIGAGLAAYGAVFAVVGATFKRPVVAGLIFAFGWEPAVLLVPGYLKQLTVGYYLQALVPHGLPQDSAVASVLQALSDPPAAGGAVVALAVITGVGLWLAARTVETKEYILEQ